MLLVKKEIYTLVSMIMAMDTKTMLGILKSIQKLLRYLQGYSDILYHGLKVR
ncbi:type IV secretion system, VirB6 family domain protein [Anaplasma phagocytophilum str. ApMUC09]|uniref:Type IV secretion system, VirB6 family domain protein n=1 Tax=Anaplasma phagocytophilum str. ApMUC09 TaxID=1359152 RepID=A0A0F3N712_ANAPH|nr:type IV secretion system, VirB6 family domain protein [Anaplasma phagocytophilum str. ApMUC09]